VNGLLSVRAGCPGRTYDADHFATLRCPRGDSAVDAARHQPRVDHCPDSELCDSPQGIWLPLHEVDGQPTLIGRTFQSQPRLSPAWYGVYQPIRAHVENAFATLTTPDGANLADRAHRASGLPGTGLWAANGIAIHNHHRLWTWWNDPDVRAALPAHDRKRLQRDVLLADRDGLARLFRQLFPE
jgi:hypothetical protein